MFTRRVRGACEEELHLRWCSSSEHAALARFLSRTVSGIGTRFSSSGFRFSFSGFQVSSSEFRVSQTLPCGLQVSQTSSSPFVTGRRVRAAREEKLDHREVPLKGRFGYRDPVFEFRFSVLCFQFSGVGFWVSSCRCKHSHF